MENEMVCLDAYLFILRLALASVEGTIPRPKSKRLVIPEVGAGQCRVYIR